MENPLLRLRTAVLDLHDEVERELAEKRRSFQYRLEQKRVVFEQEVLEHHRLLRMKISKFLQQSKILTVVTAPVIYSLIFPLVLADLFVTVYQHICFRVYKVPLVRRSEYVVMDRKYLAYLNWIEKLNCVYCEYANGVISYAREVASRTEQYWCPIKHARKIEDPHDRYYDFIEYGDGQDFHAKFKQQREKCRACEAPCQSPGPEKV